MNTQERWNYIKNNDEIIRQYMAQHDEEAKTRQLLKFLAQEKQNKDGSDALL